MPDQFDLVVTTDYPSRTAEFRLRGGHGSQIAYRHTDFNVIAVSRQQGLLDLRNYLRNYVEEENEQASVAEIGAVHRRGGAGRRNLPQALGNRIRSVNDSSSFPGTSEEENLLAAALARVPWANCAAFCRGARSGRQRHLLARLVVHDMAEPKSTPLQSGPDESHRVLLVFAEVRGSRPLAVRRERQELLESVAPGIDTVAVPDFDVDLLGHGYFAQAEGALA